MRGIFLIFRRDYLGYVKAWGFWLSIAAVPLFLILAASFGFFAAQSSPTRYYTVIAADRVFSDAIDAEFSRSEAEMAEAVSELSSQMNADVEAAEPPAPPPRRFIEVPPPETSLDGLRPYLLGERTVAGPAGDRPLFAAFILSEDGTSLQYWSNDVSVETLRRTAQSAMRELGRRQALEAAGLGPDFLTQADSAQLSVPAFRLRAAGDGPGSEVTMADRAPALVAAALAYFLWLMVFSIIQYLLMGTIEERSNKIFDTLLTSVRLPHLLAGKLLAVFAVTSTMMLSWGLFSAIISGVISSQIPGAMDVISPFIDALLNPALLAPALISFVLGYIMYGALFMALGSLCDSIQEAQTLLSPIMILLMLPMFALFIAFQDPGSPIVSAASWIPLFTPFLLILRVPQDPPLWELLAQFGMMAATVMLVVWLSTKVYRAGAVHGAGIGEAGGLIRRAVGLKPKAVAA